MGENTKIEWCDHSWSPWRGCTKVSPGCAHCYAETLSKRNPSVLGQWGKGKPRVRAKNWSEPVKWNRAASVEEASYSNNPMQARFDGNSYQLPRVFPSLCDWLDNEVPIEWLADFLKLIQETPHLQWQLLTKRPENWRRRMVEALHWMVDVNEAGPWSLATEVTTRRWFQGFPPARVWFGVSVEDRLRKERLETLHTIPAAVKFCSFEPLLEDLELTLDDVRMLDWAIIGGESGGKRRDCGVDAITGAAVACRQAGVPTFVKQDCALKPGQRGRLSDAVWGLKQFPR